MKKICFFLLLGLFTLPAMYAQQKELAVTASGLESFGFSFRTGSATGLWRINSIASSTHTYTRNYDSLYHSSSNLSLGASAGYEWRTPLDDKLHFRYGFDLSLAYAYSKRIIEDSRVSQDHRSETHDYSLMPGANLVLGVNYTLSERFLVGAEILPMARYSFDLNGAGQGFSTAVSLNSVLLSVAYVLK